MTEVIDYIEERIAEDFDYGEVAKLVCCGVYQFGRIFSYVVGTSLAEYIRNRRLSLAALELQSGNAKVIDVALKYGYNSPEAFVRAFREMHGISPKEACAKGVTLRMYPKLAFQILIKGVVDMDYRIEEKGVIKCVGRTYGLAKNEDCWQGSWGLYLDTVDETLGKTPNEVIRDKYKLYRAPYWQIGVMQSSDDGKQLVSIGAEDAGGDYPGFTRFTVPAATWARFTGNGPFVDPSPIGALFAKIFTEWLPSSGYEQSTPYTVEIYGPGDTQKSDYTFEIWVPVRKK